MLERRKGGLLFKHKKKTLAASMGMGQGGSTPGNALLDQASFYLPLDDLGSGEVNLVPLKALGSPTPTFTRATAASTVLSDGLIGYVTAGTPRSYYDPSSVVRNFCLQSEDFTQINWVPKDLNAFGSGSIANAIPGPFSGTYGTYLQEAVSGNTDRRISQGFSKGAVANTYTISIHVKAKERYYMMIRIQDTTTTNNRVDAIFNLLTGTITTTNAVGTYAYVNSSITPISDGWFRISLTGTTDTATNGVTIRFFLGNNSGAFTYSGDGVSGLYIYGAQYEESTTLGNYVPTTSAAVSKAQTYCGYLAEGARTNLILRSAEFDNASWTKTDTTMTANSIISPDGTQTADLATEGVAGTAALQQVYTSTASTVQAASVWVKRGNTDWIRFVLVDATSSGNRVTGWFNVATGQIGTAQNGGTASGATIKIIPFRDGWYRLILIGTIGTTTSIIWAVSTADADTSTTRVNDGTYYIWGAQVEQATLESSYIPTEGSTTTRNLDSLQYSINNVSNTVGTSYAEVHWPFLSSSTPDRFAIALGPAASSSGVMRTANQNDINIRDGTQSCIKTGLTALSTGVRKRATSWGSEGMAATGDGATPTTSVFDGDLENTALCIGCNTLSNSWFGTLKNVRLWTIQATPIQLQMLTAS